VPASKRSIGDFDTISHDFAVTLRDFDFKVSETGVGRQ
jgi:hypothetical protein